MLELQREICKMRVKMSKNVQILAEICIILCLSFGDQYILILDVNL